ncbi:YhdP family protein [Neisseria sp. Ec49-e6-T10]|uniref:YhdP family protein n=1 Tax=Neisseria sp. Ec49-e6-T10 TaxID=3140744 RepID=UPI003EBB0E0C
MITVFCLLLLWGSAFALFQFYVQPRLESYKQEIQHQFQEQTGSILTIDSIQGFWRILVPEFHLKGIKIEDEDPKNPPLLLQEIIAQPSWWSLFTLSPRFSYIQIQSPKLDIVRNKNNEWLLNGVLLSKKDNRKSTNSNKIFNLLLQQKHIRISKTHISFEDQFQSWPKLILNEGNLNYKHRFFRNELNLDGSLFDVGKSFNLSAAWQGDDVDQWHNWQGIVDIGVFSQSQSDFSRYLGSLFKQANVEGAALGHISFSEGTLDKLSFNMNFNNIHITDYQNNQIYFPKLSAKAFIEKKAKQHYQFGVEDVVLETEAGKSLQNGHLLGDIQLGEQGFGSLEMDKINLTSLNPILRLIGAHQNPIVRELNIRGVVHDLTAKWQGDLSKPHNIQLSSGFTGLSWQSVENIPGIDQISGVIRLDKEKGSIELQSDEAKLEIKNAYNKPFILQKLQAKLDIEKTQEHIIVTVKELTAQNNAIKNLSVSGSYTHYLKKQAQDLGVTVKAQEEQVDQLDLQVKADQVNAQNIRDFLPVFTKPRSKEWLTEAFVSGQLNNVDASIKGNPKLFPFVDGQGGSFSAKADIDQLNLLFSPVWPSIHKMVGQIHFSNERLTIHGKSGTAEGLMLSDTTAIIHNLKDKDHMWMDIDGQINGSLTQFLAFSRKTPIVKWTKGFIEQVQGQGNAGMNLKLHMPLQHVKDTEAAASLKLFNNTISFNKNQSIPKLSSVNGVITFTETGAKSEGLKAHAFGGQVFLTTKITSSRATEFSLKGNIDTQALLSFYWPEAPHVAKGNSNYQASFLLGNKKGFHQLNLKSDLNGTTFDLPIAPEELKPLSLTLDPQQNEGWLLNTKFGANNAFVAHLNQKGLASAAILVGTQTKPSLNKKGIQLIARQNEINLGQWLAIIQTQDKRFSHHKTNSNSSTPLSFDLKANEIKLNDFTLKKALLNGSLEPNRFLKVKIQSDLVSGQANLNLQQKNQLLDVHLSKLNWTIKKTNQGNSATHIQETSCFNLENIPNMNVLVDHLYINQQDYGVLSFYGKHTDRTRYQITDLLLKHPKTTITGHVALSSVAQICSQASASGQFKLESSDFGGWLSSQDLTKQLLGTKATINANLRLSKIEQLSLANLQGELDVLMKNGRFSNVQPGFGRVLGLFDLGMLRKRMMLNFSDVFLPGFTFETIKATGVIEQGVLNTSDLKIEAAGLTGKMVGNLNLQKQNMALDLSVTSNLTYGIVDSILNTQNNLPQEQKEELTEEEIASLPKSGVLTRRYRISGAWQDPKVKQY